MKDQYPIHNYKSEEFWCWICTVLKAEIAEKYGAPEYLHIVWLLINWLSMRVYSKLPPITQIEPILLNIKLNYY